MKFEHLTWDSNFFNKKIACISEVSNKDIAEIKNKLNDIKKDYNLIYIFSNNELPSFGSYVDCKIIYGGNVGDKDTFMLNENVNLYDKNEVTSEILDLGYVSGAYSRFKLDENFNKGAFESMYERWIRNAVLKKDGQDMFIYTEENNIQGILTFKLLENLCVIGLFAVHPNVQRKGIGTKLFHSLFNYLSKNNISKIEVVTQEANTDANLFYKKINLAIIKKTYIYHVWLKE